MLRHRWIFRVIFNRSRKDTNDAGAGLASHSRLAVDYFSLLGRKRMVFALVRTMRFLLSQGTVRTQEVFSSHLLSQRFPRHEAGSCRSEC